MTRRAPEASNATSSTLIGSAFQVASSVPALGYTVPYAIGNILLTAWGPVIVMMMSI